MKAVTRLGKAVTAHKSRKKVQRCPHGLLKGTCAICLRMDETTVELHTGKLAPEERPGGKAHSEEEESGDEEE